MFLKLVLYPNFSKFHMNLFEFVCFESHVTLILCGISTLTKFICKNAKWAQVHQDLCLLPISGQLYLCTQDIYFSCQCNRTEQLPVYFNCHTFWPRQVGLLDWQLQAQMRQDLHFTVPHIQQNFTLEYAQ